MFGIIFFTCVLEFIIFMPISFTLMDFLLPANIAFLLSGVLCLISIFACWLCKLKLKTFLYRIISLIVSVLLAYITAQVSLGAILVAILCIFVFIRVKSDMDSGRDIASQIAMIAILLNIALAIRNVNIISYSSTGYSNATIFISTIASVILLIFKQVDDSRRFGKNDMHIGNTQKKNNRIFAGILLVLLLAISSIGQVSKIYSLIINVFVNLLKLISNLFPTKKAVENPPAGQLPDIFEKADVKDPSTFMIILQAIMSLVAVIIIVALVGLVIYSIAKFIIKLIKRIIIWLKNGEQTYVRSTEDGHIDERESLYNRNLKNMAKKLRDMVTDLLEREIPYNKLPNDIAKIRRLFKNYKNKVQQEGIKISSSSTAEEICKEMSARSPETQQFNNLLSRCYAAARYGETAPSSQELVQFENKLLK